MKESKSRLMLRIKLKEYLSSKNLNTVSTGSSKVSNNDQNGHSTAVIIDPTSRESSSKSENRGWSSSLVRTLALRAKGRRFKSGSAHFFKSMEIQAEVPLNP